MPVLHLNHHDCSICGHTVLALKWSVTEVGWCHLAKSSGLFPCQYLFYCDTLWSLLVSESKIFTICSYSYSSSTYFFLIPLWSWSLKLSLSNPLSSQTEWMTISITCNSAHWGEFLSPLPFWDIPEWGSTCSPFSACIHIVSVWPMNHAWPLSPLLAGHKGPPCNMALDVSGGTGEALV